MGQSVDWSRCLELAASSDVGLRRANNQDAHLISLASDEETWLREGHLLMVADGMGAHAAGELASKIAVDLVPHLYRKHGILPRPEAIQRSMQEANMEIHRRGEANLEFHNMGTTGSVLLLLPQGALAAHVGDSRIYRLRGNRLCQLTFDHSLVWEMRAAGQIPADESIEHAIPRNVITRSLGPQEHVKVDIEGPFPIEVGDTFLLCSDGLTGRVPDDEIGPILAYMSVKEATDLLTDLANLRGGPDNITVIVGKVTGAEMTSRASAADPLVVGGASKESTAVHPAFWITSGVLILAAAALQVTGQSLLSLVLAAIGGCVGLVALAKVMGIFRDSGISLSGGRKLGKGPHRTANVRSARDFAEWMRITAENARRAVELRQWSVDWTTWDSLVGKGLNPSDAVPPDEVARRYAQALRDLLGQVRERIVADPHNGDHFS